MGSVTETRTFYCQGSATQQIFTVPADVHSLDLILFGGQGGNAITGASMYPGGLGGGATVSAVPVNPGDQLVIIVGCKGGDGHPAPSEGGAAGLGDGNGGKGGNPRGSNPTYGGGGGGGGGTSVSLLNSKLIAGGGGGAAWFGYGGAGGGVNGTAGRFPPSSGSGATQTSVGIGGGKNQPNTIPGNDGTNGNGGDGIDGPQSLFTSDGSGGGGGGFLGGGSGALVNLSGNGYSGGGASGHKKGLLFENAILTTGVNEGDGSVIITYVVTPTPSVHYHVHGQVSSPIVPVCDKVEMTAKITSEPSQGNRKYVMLFQVFGPFQGATEMQSLLCSGNHAMPEPIARFEVNVCSDDVISNDSSNSSTSSSSSRNGSMFVESPSFVPVSVGMYIWQATLFSDNGSQLVSTALCGPDSYPLIFSAKKATPVLTCVLGDESDLCHEPSVQLAGGCKPKGTITCHLLFRNKLLVSDEWHKCQGSGPITVVDGNGLYHCDTNKSLFMSLSCIWYEYQWECVYSGDDRNFAVSICFPC